MIARDALIEYENVVADEESPGTWGIAFDELVAAKSKHIPMAPELVARLVSDLEARLGRLMHPKAPGVIRDPFAVEAPALRLARHYRAVADEEGMRRVVRIYGEAFRAAAEKAAPLLAMAWLERVLDTYRSFGLHEEAEATEVRLRELGPGAVKEMRPISTKTEIQADEVEQFLEAITTGTLEEVLVCIAIQFIPDTGKPHQSRFSKPVRIGNLRSANHRSTVRS